MKRFYWLLCCVLCAVMLLFSDEALPTAKNAVTLWLENVLPALFPFYVASTLMYSGGLYSYVQTRFPRLTLPLCLCLGAVSGYPVGAKLCALTGRSDISVYCNLCSPAFLLGVAVVGMLGQRELMLPLSIAHYGAAILACLANRLFKRDSQMEYSGSAHVSSVGLPQAIRDGMIAMLSVGGCIVFFSVCARLIVTVLHLDSTFLGAALTGLLEMTAGCQALAALTLPIRLRCACMAAVISFGGLSVWMQAQSTACGLKAFPYLFGKAFQAALAFILSYMITPWCCPEADAVLFSYTDQLITNASALTTLLLAAGAAMTFIYLSALVMKAAQHHKGVER